MTLIKLRQKLFLLLFALLSVGLVLPTYVINRTIDTQVKTEITNSLLSHNKAFELYSRSSNLDIGIAALNFSKQTGLRVTLIAKDGKVEKIKTLVSTLNSVDAQKWLLKASKDLKFSAHKEGSVLTLPLMFS